MRERGGEREYKGKGYRSMTVNGQKIWKRAGVLETLPVGIEHDVRLMVRDAGMGEMLPRR